MRAKRRLPAEDAVMLNFHVSARNRPSDVGTRVPGGILAGEGRVCLGEVVVRPEEPFDRWPVPVNNASVTAAQLWIATSGDSPNPLSTYCRRLAATLR